jgi:hypothetical protein
MMTVRLIAQYTGFWKCTVKRHIKPSAFKKLSNEKLKKYAEIFEIRIEALKNPFEPTV